MARGYGYGGYGDSGYGFRPYVPVAQRRAEAKRYANQMAKNGQKVQPVEISGRKIATTFWGQAWCDNLESYSDFANRLPRGRTYVRNGSVVDLRISKGQIDAIVSGSDIYKVQVQITPLAAATWKKIQQDCAREIDSLMDLLRGRFSQGVMQRLTQQKDGLFPQPKEIKMGCSCPDWAVLCKHVAAVLYGVGARLDTEPELLFQLRDVDHLDLISQAVDKSNLDAAFSSDTADSLQGQDLSDLFGIELDAASEATPQRGRASRRSSKNRTPDKETPQKPVAPSTSKTATKRAVVPEQVKAVVKPAASQVVVRSAKKKVAASKSTATRSAHGTTTVKAVKRKVTKKK